MEMITTREDGDSIHHISIAFEIGAKIKIALTSVRSLDRKLKSNNNVEHIEQISSVKGLNSSIYLCKNHF